MPSKIEWTGETWNPIVGCSLASPGCTNCYAMRDAYRKGFNPKVPHYHGLTRLVNGNPVWTGALRQAPEHVLLKPLRTRKPTTWFVNSMSDLFHESVPDEWIDAIWAVMILSPQHTFQILTKRPERMRAYLTAGRSRYAAVLVAGNRLRRQLPKLRLGDIPIDDPAAAAFHRNIWLGTSCEDQRRADERLTPLRLTPAAIRFLSIEPLLEDLGKINLTGISWVICGGESGPKARPMHPDWARGLRDQCVAAGVPFFFKQWGEWLDVDSETFQELMSRERRFEEMSEYVEPTNGCYRVGKQAAGATLDGREWRQMPQPEARDAG